MKLTFTITLLAACFFITPVVSPPADPGPAPEFPKETSDALRAASTQCLLDVRHKHGNDLIRQQRFEELKKTDPKTTKKLEDIKLDYDSIPMLKTTNIPLQMPSDSIPPAGKPNEAKNEAAESNAEADDVENFPKMTPEDFKLRRRMLQAIDDGYQKNFGCTVGTRLAHSIGGIVRPKDGEFQPDWIRDCMRQRLPGITKNAEFQRVFGTPNDPNSEDALMSLIQSLNCPIQGLDPDAKDPYEELGKLPTSLKKQLNLMIKRTGRYIHCVIDVVTREASATLTRLFVCDGDRSLYDKVRACSAKQTVNDADRFVFPNLDDQRAKEITQQPTAITTDATIAAQNKPGKVKTFLNKMAKWTYAKLCHVAAKVDALPETWKNFKGQASTGLSNLKGRIVGKPGGSQIPSTADVDLPEIKKRRKRVPKQELQFGLSCLQLF